MDENTQNINDVITKIENISRDIIKTYAKLVNIKPQLHSYENSSLFSDDSVFDGEIIIKNIDDFRQILADKQKENKQIFDKNFKEDDLLFELIIIEHQSLFLILFERIYLNEDLKDIEKDSWTFKSITYLCFLLNLNINNLIIMQKSLHYGFNHQLNLVFRNYIELSEISLAIIIDEDFFNAYKQDPENKNEINKKWKKVKPNAVHDLIGKEYNRIDELTDWWECISDMRNSLYDKTSGFVHGNYLRFLTESFSNELNIDSLSLTLLGLISDNLKITFEESIIYSKIFIRDVLIFLVKNHNLYFNNFGQDGLDHLYLQSVTNYMFKDYIEKIKSR